MGFPSSSGGFHGEWGLSGACPQSVSSLPCCQEAAQSELATGSASVEGLGCWQSGGARRRLHLRGTHGRRILRARSLTTCQAEQQSVGCERSVGCELRSRLQNSGWHHPASPPRRPCCPSPVKLSSVSRQLSEHHGNFQTLRARWQLSDNSAVATFSSDNDKQYIRVFCPPRGIFLDTFPCILVQPPRASLCYP